MLPKCKVGNCSQCPAENTNCVKVGKELFCLKCHKAKKTQALIDKQDKDPELEKWFEDRHEEMTGICKHCGGRTEAGKSSYKCSVAHILPKSVFPSIKTHPLNWIELCFYDNSCHTNFDHFMLEIQDLKCFDEVVEKFIAMYPFIAPEERKRIPSILNLSIPTNQRI
jgi:hypothetical protein